MEALMKSSKVVDVVPQPVARIKAVGGSQAPQTPLPKTAKGSSAPKPSGTNAKASGSAPSHIAHLKAHGIY
jgi:hypothetical protein